MLILNEADKVLMIPGPTPVQREILTALGEPTISHTSKAIADIIREAQDGLRLVAGTDEAQIFAFGGAGTLAQEAALVNLVAPGERVLVASNGYFGDRFADMAQAHGIEVDHVQAPWGESVTPQEIDARLAANPARAVTITHVETSTGVAAPVADLAAVARRHGAHVIVDAVCSLGGVPMEMDSWDIDIVLTGAQKALGVPPGLSLLAVAPRALTRRRTMDGIAAYYADLLNWEASMENPQIYFSTHAVNLFYALLAGVEIIRREGLPNRFERHLRLALGFRAGMRALGFTSLTSEPYLAPTMSVMAYPVGIDDEDFRTGMADRGVVVAACLGSFKGRGARFGHMGNITETEVLQALSAVEATLESLGRQGAAGKGVSAAQEQWMPVSEAV